MNIFKQGSIEENAQMLANHLPKGKAWDKAFDPDDDFGKLFFGLALEFWRSQALIELFQKESDMSKSLQLLSDWEESVGIPDSIFSTNETIDRRQLQIVQRFTNLVVYQNQKISLELHHFLDLISNMCQKNNYFSLYYFLLFFQLI